MEAKEEVLKLQKEIVELFNAKERTGSLKHFYKCLDKIDEKQIELFLLGGEDPLKTKQ